MRTLRPWTLSYEMMPPRNINAAPKFWECSKKLVESSPDFISLTYGAGGKDRRNSLEVIKKLVKDSPIMPIAHLTSIGTEKDEVETIAQEFLDAGVRMFLALRGDIPEDSHDFDSIKNPISSASELTHILHMLDLKHRRENSANYFNSIVRPLIICVAAFPEGNISRGTTPEEEAVRLLEKQDAGANFAITQLYYNPLSFDSFVHICRKIGVTIPIVAGVLPTYELDRIIKCENYIGVKAPQKLCAQLESAKSTQHQEEIAMDFWEDLSRKAIESGSPGIHMFTFNKYEPPINLADRLGLL